MLFINITDLYSISYISLYILYKKTGLYNKSEISHIIKLNDLII